MKKQNSDGIWLLLLCALVVMLIILKITGVIDWHLLWITAPLWVAFVVFFAFLILMFLIKINAEFLIFIFERIQKKNANH